jgi:hypothetical protein
MVGGRDPDRLKHHAASSLALSADGEPLAFSSRVISCRDLTSYLISDHSKLRPTASVSKCQHFIEVSV